MYKYLLVLFLILQADFSFGQIIMIQTQSDAKIGMDRKAWNGIGNTASNSDGYAHDFTLPARTNACQKITGIKVEISLLSYSNNNVCPHFTTYYNLFYGCTTYAGGATCLPATNLVAEPNYSPNTSPPPFNFGSPLNSPRNSTIIPDFGGNFSIDIIPVGTPGCNPVIKGYLSYKYTIKVTVTVTDITPIKPAIVNCWDNFVFNTTTCIWENTGKQPTQPTKVNCWDNYVFNSTTCIWENTGKKPAQPTKATCWDNYVFNTTSCAWENTGKQPTQPTKVNCWDNYVFNSTTCVWENTGNQPAQPTKSTCWDNYVFNTTSCVWDNNGTKPTQPTTKCYETFLFNNGTCSWDISGNQPVKPNLQCWESATFNAATCIWDVSGNQPARPAKVNCWDNWVFNTTSCIWDNTGIQTGNITTENLELCEDSKLTLEAQTNLPNPSYSWSNGAISKDITIDRPGTFTVGITAGVCSFETKIFNVKFLGKPIVENVISDGNNIIITTSNTGDFIYSLDENIYQSSNVFSNVVSGFYNIFVKQQNCKSTISLEHWHLYLPKFFTPNNDGINDLWEINEMKNFPNSSASIYDRYGKLIINLNASNYRWDGRYNDIPLPADDYWYLLKLDHSKPEVKGHFSLER